MGQMPRPQPPRTQIHKWPLFNLEPALLHSAAQCINVHRSAQKCRKSHDGHYPIHGYPAPPCKAVEHNSDPNHAAFDGTRNSNASKCIFTERAKSRWLLRGIWRSCSPINSFEHLYKMLKPIVFRKNRGSSLELPAPFNELFREERKAGYSD